jgi:hypothetical protein
MHEIHRWFVEKSDKQMPVAKINYIKVSFNQFISQQQKLITCISAKTKNDLVKYH